LALGLATLAAMVPQRAMLQHTDVEGGGELRMARKRAALRAVLDFYSEYAGAQVAGSQYDTNAIGEAWGGAAMGHFWVDRPSATAKAEHLEDELRAIRVGRRSASHPQRLAMREKRLARQRELDSRPPRHENAMLHWARPTEDPEYLESELATMTVGGLDIDAEPRKAMFHKRMAARSAYT